MLRRKSISREGIYNYEARRILRRASSIIVTDSDIVVGVDATPATHAQSSIIEGLEEHSNLDQNLDLTQNLDEVLQVDDDVVNLEATTKKHKHSAPDSKKSRRKRKVLLYLSFALLFISFFSAGAALQWQIFGAREVVIHEPYCGVVCNPEDMPIWQGITKVDRPPTPEYGSVVGQIDIDKIDVHMSIKLGSDLNNLSNGQTAMYSGSKLPGNFGMTLMGGHNYWGSVPGFGKIYYLEPGDTFKITTNYGIFHYKVIDKHVEAAATYPVEEKLAQNDRRFAVLYSCYPIDSASTPNRTFVEADLVDGPLLK